MIDRDKVNERDLASISDIETSPHKAAHGGFLSVEQQTPRNHQQLLRDHVSKCTRIVYPNNHLYRLPKHSRHWCRQNAFAANGSSVYIRFQIRLQQKSSARLLMSRHTPSFQSCLKFPRVDFHSIPVVTLMLAAAQYPPHPRGTRQLWSP